MKAGGHFGAVLWIGLALGASTNSTSAPMTEPEVRTGNQAASPHAGVSMGLQAHVAAPRTVPDFSGHWIFNARASDDPREKLREAMKSMRQAPGGRRGMGGGSGGHERGGGKSRGRQGHGASAGPGGRSDMPREAWTALTATPARLDITHEDPMLLIADEHERRQRIFTDFRGTSVSASSGLQQRAMVAGWEDGALVVETALEGGTRLTQTYRIDAPTGQLMISAAASLAEKQAVSFRLVYDRAGSEADAGAR